MTSTVTGRETPVVTTKNCLQILSNAQMVLMKQWTGSKLEKEYEKAVYRHPAYLLPLGLALGSPIFPSGGEGKLGVALESLQGRRDLT